MGLLDTNYQDQRLTASQKKKIKPAIQGGGYNYLGKQEEVTVPKKWLSDPDHVVAELAYITPREKKVLIDLNMYGSLDGKPNNAPGGLPSLQGDMGSVGGGSSGGGGSGGGGGGSGGGGSGGGRQDVESQYGGDYSYDSSQNVSTREQQFGGGRDDKYVTPDPELPPGVKDLQLALLDPDPEVDVSPEDRDSITSFLDNYAAAVKSDPFNLGVVGALKTLYQTEKAKDMLAGMPGYEFLNDSGNGGDNQITTDTDRGSGDVITNLVSQLPYTMAGTTPQQSMVNQYFSNLNLGQALSSNLQTSYNNAKNTMNNLLGINPTSQQFGYSTQPYGGLMASNLTTNPYNIDYLRRLGLI